MRKWLPFALLLFAAPAHADALSAMRFNELGGGRQTIAALKGRPNLIVLWRSDCAPCMHELRLLPYLADNFPSLPVTLLSLHSEEQTRASVRDMPELVRQWTSEATPEKTFAAFGDTKKELPFSVMLNSKGRVCYRHYGLIGTDAIEEGLKQCK